MLKFIHLLTLTGAFFLIPMTGLLAQGATQHKAELIFPLETWHNHGSCIVEASNGDLIVCWFHGSGGKEIG